MLNTDKGQNPVTLFLHRKLYLAKNIVIQTIWALKKCEQYKLDKNKEICLLRERRNTHS